MKSTMVKLNKVNKFYGDSHVAKNISLDIYEGEFLTLLGSSGSGKTTTLRMIAGFESIDSGDVFVAGKNVSDKEPFEREVNTVFQNYALFPHMTVAENIAYGLKLKKLPKNEIERKVTEMLELVQLKEFGPRKIDALSGGQKQRIAIARAIVNNPKVLLLDEPLGALDLKLRKQMQFELKRLQKKLGITFIYVTHDQEEALSMSDRIAIMHNGELEQIGTPAEIYNRPISRFIAEFIGESNVLSGEIQRVNNNLAEIMTPCGMICSYSKNPPASNEAAISIRPERISLKKSPVNSFSPECIITEQIYKGSTIRYLAVTTQGNIEFKADIPSNCNDFAIGDKAYLYWECADAFLITDQTEPAATAQILPLKEKNKAEAAEKLQMMEKAI